MLTPAEEMGLSGMSLASRVRKAFYGLAEPKALELMQRLREEAFRRHLIYMRDGALDTIHVLACPLTILPDQLAVEAMRQLFEQNRIISSITAELDQKRCWEVFTDPTLTHRHFTADERQVFRRHILWTRIVVDRKTLLPDGQTGSLLEYARREHELLVLKPNRSYGGEGVLLGHSMTRGEWETALERTLTGGERWVVQQLAGIAVYELPVAGPAILGRASQKQVVNIAQRGGMCAVVVGHPPGKLVGPRPR